MAEKNDLQGSGGDRGLSQHRFPFASGLPDTMPVPGITLGLLRLSNDDVITDVPCFLLTVSAPPNVKNQQVIYFRVNAQHRPT